ncbi:MAG: TIGR01212 family radical SAM protein [Bdellovibrionia bacterium]
MSQILPYNSIGEFYRGRFGARVQKIPVSIATDCPNRLGLKGMKTCVFCDEWGSSAYPERRAEELRDQLANTIKDRAARYGATKFIAYFQAYTSTFLAISKLRESFETALAFPEVHGIIIGTRPDCLSPTLLKFLNEYAQKTYLSVELGIQTLNDADLTFMRRGHTAAQSLEAIRKIAAEAPELDLGVHLMFGNPNETREELVETARRLSELKLGHVKLHNLHVLKNTPLAQMYSAGEFAPIELEEYTERVILFLRHLASHVRVHRLAAVASRWDELVAPEWTRHKMKISQHIIDTMNKRGVRQGQDALQ